MSRGINRCIVLGHLGADPEVRYAQSGTAICTLSIATSEQWTDKQSNERKERTEWHRVKLFGKLGEIAGEYLKKGRQVYIEGSIRTEKYTDKEGIERYATDIVASEMQMIGGGNDRDSDAGSGGQRPSQSGRTSGGGHGANRQPSPARETRQAVHSAAMNDGFDDGDIPFCRQSGIF